MKSFGEQSGYWMLDAGYWMLDTGHWLLVFWYSVLWSLVPRTHID
jgi:hypothetical protein